MTGDDRTVGLLHPGAMGVTVGAACRAAVVWAAAGRSPATRDRAAAAGLTDVGDLAAVVDRSDVIVSVCPPEAALDVADQVARCGFAGLYVDANAIAPTTARTIGTRFDRFVDGGIIGPPALRPGTTRLYLAGDAADDVAALWSGSPLDARVLDGAAGAASALKLAYAAWTKVSSALLLEVRAEGVEAALLAEWALSQPGTEDRAATTARAVAPKAWRFAGEMREIAAALDAVGLPDAFGIAAADLYDRLADLRDEPDADLEHVLRELLS